MDLAKLPARIVLILKWLLQNKDLVLYSDAIRINLDIKGTSVKGSVTVMPDNKI